MLPQTIDWGSVSGVILLLIIIILLLFLLLFLFLFFFLFLLFFLFLSESRDNFDPKTAVHEIGNAQLENSNSLPLHSTCSRVSELAELPNLTYLFQS